MGCNSVFLQQPFLVVPSSIEPELSHQRVSQRVALSLAYARYIRHLLTSPLRPSKLEPRKDGFAAPPLLKMKSPAPSPMRNLQGRERSEPPPTCPARPPELKTQSPDLTPSPPCSRAEYFVRARSVWHNSCPRKTAATGRGGGRGASDEFEQQVCIVRRPDQARTGKSQTNAGDSVNP